MSTPLFSLFSYPFMPQFDLNLLNFQSIIIYIFCVSYLFYLKEINVYFMYFLKLPNRLNLFLFFIFFSKKRYWDEIIRSMLFTLLSNFKKVRLLCYILSIDNKNIFYYDII